MPSIKISRAAPTSQGYDAAPGSHRIRRQPPSVWRARQRAGTLMAPDSRGAAGFVPLADADLLTAR
jgi:hypothetical protein